MISSLRIESEKWEDKRNGFEVVVKPLMDFFFFKFSKSHKFKLEWRTSEVATPRTRHAYEFHGINFSALLEFYVSRLELHVELFVSLYAFE